ncbi:Uncharacterised protein [Corynebacterium diphtheriae]|nr:Uncharacterised protein [Corynebacterium diphtheriae]
MFGAIGKAHQQTPNVTMLFRFIEQKMGLYKVETPFKPDL